jgi:hypothetical protein
MIKLLTACFLFSTISLAKEFKAQYSPKNNNISITIEGKNSQIPVTIPKDMHVENELQIYSHGKIHIIIMDLSDYSAASSLVFAIDDSGKKLWELNLGGFNPAPPLVEDKYVYLSAIGKVWKLEKLSGNVIWSHHGLYENKKYEFNGSEEIKRKGPWIEFSKNLLVNDETGKIGGQN